MCLFIGAPLSQVMVFEDDDTFNPGNSEAASSFRSGWDMIA